MDAFAQEKEMKQTDGVDMKLFEKKMVDYFEEVLKKLSSKNQNILISEKVQTQT